MKHLFSVCLTVFILVMCFSMYTGDIEDKKEWYDNDRIAHACGGIDSVDYTNSREALQNALDKNIKLIEVDFRFTSDNRLVCLHKWTNIKKKEPVEYKYFKSYKIKGKYHTLTAEELLRTLAKYKDVYLIVDFKNEDIVDIYKEIDRLCLSLGRKGRLLRNRIIPQLYKDEQYDELKKIYDYKQWIYTTYKQHPELNDYRRIASFCKKNGIQVVTVPAKKINDGIIHILKENDLHVATHTINKASVYNELKKRGVDIIYTDYLLDEDIVIDTEEDSSK